MKRSRTSAEKRARRAADPNAALHERAAASLDRIGEESSWPDWHTRGTLGAGGESVERRRRPAPPAASYYRQRDAARGRGHPSPARGMTMQTHPSESIKPGTILAGKYRLLCPIGRGSMGWVWAAMNQTTSREVAVKLLLGSSPDLQHRLMREAHACGALKHPNVIDIYDVTETDSGEPFLVMELLTGETLAQLLKERRRLE